MHKVTNYREVKYDFDTKLNAPHWDEFMREVNFTTFDAPDDYYAVYENLDEEDDHERRKYAVYLHSTGELICLMTDCGCVLDCCYDDAEYMEQRNELYRQIAILAGWPKKIPTKDIYEVTLVRTIRIRVYADSGKQAKEIGEALACGNTDLACEIVNNAMCNGDDEVWYVSKAGVSGFWHTKLTKEECEQLISEED